MNRKHFGILILLAGVLIVLAVLSRQGGDSGPIAGDTAGTPFLQDLADELDGIDQVRIDGPGSERLVSLQRAADDWIIAEIDGYPADRAEVNALLIALGEALIVEEKTANPDFHDRLGVEDIASAEATGIEVVLFSGGAERYRAVVGGSYGGGQRYARVSGSDQSVLIDRDPDILTDPSDWVADEILDVAANRIQRVAIAHADGESLVVRKAARGDFDFAVDDIPADRDLQYAGIANVTGNLLQDLRLELVERRPTVTGEQTAVIDFAAFDGLVITVTAEAATDGEEPWLAFEARFDADQAAAFADPGIDQDSTSAAPEEPIAAPGTGAEDVSAEADEINARLAGWRFRIASFKYSQLTRRMEDLLQLESDE